MIEPGKRARSAPTTASQRKKPRDQRSLTLEALEERTLLDGALPAILPGVEGDVTPPTVTGLFVKGSSWPASFLNGLDPRGYRVPVGSADQLITLPWTNVDQIAIEFSEDVEVDQPDLELYGSNVQQYAFLPAGGGGFTYSVATLTATWKLAQPIGQDHVVAILAGTGNDPVQDEEANVLDGNWINPGGVLPPTDYPSGDGAAGGDFIFQFNVSPGNVNDDALVNVIDVLLTRLRLGAAPGSASYDHNFDVDASGQIDVFDVLLNRLRLGSAQPGDPLVMISGLADDTGSDSADGITFDASIVGTLTAGQNVGVETFLAGFDDTPIASFVDVAADLADNGSFFFDVDRITAINGGPLSDGAHVLHLRATNSDNKLFTLDIPFTLDTVAPAAPTGLGLTAATDLGPSNSDAITSDTTPDLQANAENGSTIQFFRNGDLLGQGVAAGTVTVAAGTLVDGNHEFRAIAIDRAGNESSEASRTAVVDSRPPDINIVSPATDDEVRPGAVLNGFTDASDARIAAVTYRFDSLANRSIPVGATGSFFGEIDVTGVLAGDHTITVNATDLAGNTASTQIEVTVDPTVPFQIERFSPHDGEEQVSIMVRPQIFFSSPIDPDTLNNTNFFASSGGQTIPANIVPANDGTFAWLFWQDELPSSNMIEVTVDGSTILPPGGGPALDADGDGMPGGALTYSFSTLSVTPVPGTSLTGQIVDPGPDLVPFTADDVDPGLDGEFKTMDDTFLLPIQGATIFILGLENQTVLTDANGRFTLDPVPVGHVKVVIDGRTSTNPTPGYYFPELVMDAKMTLGASNSVMMGMDFMQLPRVPDSVLETMSAATGGSITVSPEGAYNLTPEQQQFLRIDVPPNSFVGHDGQMLASGTIGLAVVPPELVETMLPPGVLQHTFDITVQAMDFANLSTPAPMTFPNVSNAPPGSKLNLLSFDHTTGLLVIEGTATVSADGLSVTTDPGTGISHPGWHGLTPPGTNVGFGGGGASRGLGVLGANGGGGLPPLPQPTSCDNPLEPFVGFNKDYFFHRDEGTVRLMLTNYKNSVQNCRLNFNLRFEGPAADFLEGSIGFLPTSSLGADMAQDLSFSLEPGGRNEYTLEIRDLITDANLNAATENTLYGVKMIATITRADTGAQVAQDTAFIYRFFDAADDDPADGRVRFPRTFADGDGGVVNPIPLRTFTGPSAIPTFSLQTGVDFNVSPTVFEADPTRSTGGLFDTVRITAPGRLAPAGGLELGVANAVGTQNVLWSQAAFSNSLAFILDSPAQFPNSANFATLFPADSADGGTLRSDEPGFATVVAQLYNAVVSNLVTGGMSSIFGQLAPGATSAFVVLDSASGAGIQVNANLARGGNVCGPAATPACAYWADFNKDLFATYTPPPSGSPRGTPPTLTGGRAATKNSISALSERLYFDRFLNRSYSDDAGGRTQAVNMNWDVLSGNTNVNMAPAANLMTAVTNIFANAIAHEVGHDLGAIHLRSTTNNYVWGDVMGNDGTRTDRLAVFNTFSPLIRMALGLPVTLTESISTWNYYEMFEGLETYRHNLSLLGPGSNPDDVLSDTAVLFVLAGPLVPGSELPSFVDEAVFTPTIADGTGGQVGTFDVYLTNTGGHEFTIESVTLGEGDQGFTIDSIGTLPHILPPLDPDDLQPDASTLRVTLRFDPTAAGTFTDVLRIGTDILGLKEIPVVGRGVSPFGDIEVTVDNNNVGGQRVGAGTVTRASFATIENIGAMPLSITDFVIAGGVGQYNVSGLPVGFGSGNPIVLQPGESIPFDVVFDPNATGLQRGEIQILSSDPDTPARSVRLVATGRVDSGTNLDFGNDFVVLGTPAIAGSRPIRVRSDAEGSWNIFTDAETAIKYAMFDPISGLIANQATVSAVSGQNTFLPDPIFQASEAPDTDGDGLPDDIEFAIGTATDRADTDNDGTDDFAEVIVNGTDPFGGRLLPIGIVASLSQAELQRTAPIVLTSEVVVEVAQDGVGQTAYVATKGLTIVDVSNFQQPVVLGYLDVGFPALDVAVDRNLGLAAVATGVSLHVVDVRDPANPVELYSLPLGPGFPDVRVEVFEGRAYVAGGASLHVINLLDGAEVARLTTAAPVTDVAREQATLYSLDNTGRLSAFDITPDGLAVRDSITLAEFGGRLFVGNGVAYVGVAGFTSGFSTVNVSDPDNLTLLSGVDENTIATRILAANGSGLGIGIGSPGGAFGVNALDVVSVVDPTDTGANITRVPLPAAPLGLALSAGIAYVANGTAGLQIVNYLAFDNESDAPTITLSTLTPDLDPMLPGTQITEGGTVRLQADVTDDFQVRNVELLRDGVVLSNDITFPFDLAAAAVGTDPDAPTLTFQARATDTAGNVSLSNLLTIDLVPDTFAPTVQAISPEDGSRRGQNLRTIAVRFNEALDPATITAANFELRNGANAIVPADRIDLVAFDRTVQLTFDPLPADDYTFTVHRANIRDRAGNAGTGDVTSSFELVTATILWVGGDGNWSNPANWDLNRIPNATDVVLIDVPGAPTITHNQGVTVVDTLFVEDHLQVLGGSLTATTEGLVRNLDLVAGTFGGAVTLVGDSTWTGGTLAGATNAGTINVSGGSSKTLAGVLSNTGRFAHHEGGLFLSTATFVNQAGGIIDFTADTVFSHSSGTNVVTNSGTVRKSGGTGTSSFGVPFNSTAGTIDVQSGRFIMNGGTSTNDTLMAAAGATIDLTGGSTRTYAGTITPVGTGTFLLQSGALTADAGGLTLNFPETVFQWTGGAINGSFTNAGTINVSGGSSKSLNNGTLTNTGRFAHHAGGLFLNSTTFVNQAGGIIDFTADTAFSHSTGTNVVTNSGTVRKSGGTGTSSFGVPFNSTAGTIDIQSGRFNMNAGLSTNDTLMAAPGTTIDLTGSSTRTFAATITPLGTGTFLMEGGTLAADSSGLTLNFPTTVFQWTGGTITGSFTNAGTINVSGGSSKSLSNGTLTNTGLFKHHLGSLFLNSMTFVNQTGGIIDFTADTAFSHSSGANLVTNSGMVRKSGGSGTSSFGVPFNSTAGTIDIQSGRFNMNGGTSTNDTLMAAAGTTIDLTGSSTRTYAGTITPVGTGTFLLEGGFLTADSGGLTLNFPGTVFQWTGGTINGSFTNAGAINVSGGSSKSLSNGTLTNTGLFAHHLGSLFLNSMTFVNQTGGIIDFTADTAFSHSTGTNVVTNSGMVRKSGGSGTSSFGVPFNSTAGTIDIQSGRFNMNGGTSTNDTLMAAAGTTIDLTGGSTRTYAGTITPVGTGTFLMESGTLAADSSGLTLNFPTTVFQWTGGTINGSFTNAGAINVSGGSSKSLSNSTLTNTGLFAHHAGALFFSSTIFDNQAGGIIDFTADTAFSHSAGTNLVTNVGTIRKTGGAATSAIGIPTTNTGTIQSSSGTLRLASTYTHTSGAVVLSGGNLQFDSGLNLQAGEVRGAGTITGNVINSGTVRPGDSPGILTITGSYTQAAAGAISIEVGGLNVGTEYDRLAVSGTATLAGTLNLSLLNGFEPSIGNTFQIVTAGTVLNTFSTVTGTALPNSRQFTPVYSAVDVSLAVLPALQGLSAPGDEGGDAPSSFGPASEQQTRRGVKAKLLQSRAVDALFGDDDAFLALLLGEE